MEFKIPRIKKFVTTADSSGFCLTAGVVDNFRETRVNVRDRMIAFFSYQTTLIHRNPSLEGAIYVWLHNPSGVGPNTIRLTPRRVKQFGVKNQYEMKAILDEALSAIEGKLVYLYPWD